MRSTLLILLFGLLLGSLCAQTGLFDISYDDPVAKADSILFAFGFHAEAQDGAMLKYYSDVDPMVDAIVLFINPKNLRVAGWFVKHKARLGQDVDRLIYDRLYDLHGESAHMDEATQQLVWVLSKTRTLHVAYVDDFSLAVLYTDSQYPELFVIPKTERKNTEH